MSAEQAQADLRLLQRALAALHPGLHRYATPAQLEVAFDEAQAAVRGGTDRAALFLQVTRLAAALRCGHTWTNPYNQRSEVQALALRPDKLPVTLRLVAGRALVTGSAVPAAVPPGSELLAIDDRPWAGLVAALLPLLRADGGADGKRLSQLDHGPTGGAMDRLFPLRFPPGAAGYRLLLRGPAATDPVRVVDVPAMDLAARDAAIGAPGIDSAWSVQVEGDTALLTLPTFAFWRGGFDGPAFLARLFDELAQRGTAFLVIDNRRNEGGDDALGLALLRHLLRAPLTLPGAQRISAYERAPYALARHLDTWDFDFLDRTGQVQRDALGRWRLADTPPHTVLPLARPFAGRTVLLTGPQNSSAGYLLARNLKLAGAATLLGQPTGGNQRGLNGGQLAWLTLPHSGIAVDIPLTAHHVLGDPPEGGVLPDQPVAPDWDDAVAGRDTELLAARGLVARWRAG